MWWKLSLFSLVFFCLRSIGRCPPHNPPQTRRQTQQTLSAEANQPPINCWALSSAHNWWLLSCLLPWLTALPLSSLGRREIDSISLTPRETIPSINWFHYFSRLPFHFITLTHKSILLSFFRQFIKSFFIDSLERKKSEMTSWLFAVVLSLWRSPWLPCSP